MIKPNQAEGGRMKIEIRECEGCGEIKECEETWGGYWLCSYECLQILYCDDIPEAEDFVSAHA